jgi:FtsH-binding integral membrane protein
MPYAESSLLRAMKGGGCGCGFDFSNFMKGGANAKGKTAFKSGFIDLIMEKKQFLLLVFSNLIVQLGISYYLMMNYKGPQFSFWFMLLASISILFIMILVPMHPFLKFILFCIFSALFGTNLAFITSKNGKNGNNEEEKKELIHLVILQTISVFGAMFLVGAFLLASNIKLGLQFAAFLFYSLLLLIISRLWIMFSGTMNLHTFALSVVGILLFSLYIIYDTNIILRREYYGDFITASMDYYLDIINLFSNLFRINE